MNCLKRERRIQEREKERKKLLERFQERKRSLDERYYRYYEEVNTTLREDVKNLYTKIQNYLECINNVTYEILKRFGPTATIYEYQPPLFRSETREVIIEQNTTNMGFISNSHPPYVLPFTDETIRDIGANTIDSAIEHLETFAKYYNELTGIQIDMDVVTGHINKILVEEYGSVNKFKNSEKAFNEANVVISDLSRRDEHNIFTNWYDPNLNLDKREAILNKYEELLNVVRANMFRTIIWGERADDDVDMHIDDSD